MAFSTSISLFRRATEPSTLLYPLQMDQHNSLHKFTLPSKIICNFEHGFRRFLLCLDLAAAGGEREELRPVGVIDDRQEHVQQDEEAGEDVEDEVGWTWD